MSESKSVEDPSVRMRDKADAVLRHANLGTIDDYDVAYESPGQKSIVLFSKQNPEDVVKIPFSGDDSDQSRIWRKAFLSEAKTLIQLDAIGIQSVVIPGVKAIGHDPDYIQMTRLGPTLKEAWQKQGPPDSNEINAVGRALAEFVVELHKKTGGMVHKDLHFQNVTRQPNGRYGCLDFEGCTPGSFEEAFTGLALEEQNILPAASGRIRELTGKGLDAEKLRQGATKGANIWWGGDPGVIARVEKNCAELAKANGPAQNRPLPNQTLGMPEKKNLLAPKAAVS